MNVNIGKFVKEEDIVNVNIGKFVKDEDLNVEGILLDNMDTYAIRNAIQEAIEERCEYINAYDIASEIEDEVWEKLSKLSEDVVAMEDLDAIVLEQPEPKQVMNEVIVTKQVVEGIRNFMIKAVKQMESFEFKEAKKSIDELIVSMNNLMTLFNQEKEIER